MIELDLSGKGKSNPHGGAPQNPRRQYNNQQQMYPNNKSGISKPPGIGPPGMGNINPPGMDMSSQSDMNPSKKNNMNSNNLPEQNNTNQYDMNMENDDKNQS